MDPEEFVWLNEELLPLSQARVSVNDRGFQYGDGFFETLRAEDGRVRFLAEHLQRLRASARAFGVAFPEGVPWEERIGKVLAANGATRRLARVRLQLTRGLAVGVGLPRADRPTLVIWAQPYEPPAPAEYAAGWPVVIFPEPRSTFLGRHKSLNYLFYLAARQYALDQGAREALILEVDGLVSEGSATSLVFAQGGQYYTPAAASALPGVSVAVLGRGLAREGLALKAIPTSVDHLRHASGLWLANSLLGVMPVASINGGPVPLAPGTTLLREILFPPA